MFEECRLEADKETGFFTLSSGRKSKVFYDFDLLSPRETAQYVEQLVRQVPDEVWDKVDFIASPALGGIVPGFLVAFAKRKPFVYIDKEGGIRGPKFGAGRYLIVDDVITSFKTVNAVRHSLWGSSSKLEAVGVAAYIFRGLRSDLVSQPCPVFYLARKEPEE